MDHPKIHTRVYLCHSFHYLFININCEGVTEKKPKKRIIVEDFLCILAAAERQMIGITIRRVD